MDTRYVNVHQSGWYAWRAHITFSIAHRTPARAQAGNYGAPGGLKTIDTLNAADLVTDADGSFEIVVASTRPEGAANWLRSVADPPEGLVLVRQTYLLRESETLATMNIQLRGVPRTVPAKWSAEALDGGLAQCGMLVAGAPMMFARWASGFQKHTNQLPLFDQATSDAVGGDPTIRYYHSYWALGPDEALVVEATPPQCTFWNMQINNHFSESLDYRCVCRPVCQPAWGRSCCTARL